MDVLGQAKGFFKKNPGKAAIDNLVFRAHYRATFAILMVFSLLVISRQYLGDPIDCITRDDIPNKLLDTYCWVHTTFSMDDAWDKEVGEEVPYPGIGPSKSGGKKVYHAYYQWVCWVLAVQALFFYVPHYIWKAVEGGKLSKLMQNLKEPILNEDARKQQTGLLVDYFNRNLYVSHSPYFYTFVLAEVMNFVNVVGQMFLMDKFLGGEFSKYGSKVLSFTEYDWKVRDDPMIRVFPRLTKCTFHRYGPSGDVQRHDSMCILPINILNEKLYVILWFWFVILATISGLTLLYRAALVLLPKLRVLLVKSKNRQTYSEDIETVLDQCNFGDFMIISLLGNNMDPINYKEFMRELAENMPERPYSAASNDDATLTKTKKLVA